MFHAEDFRPELPEGLARLAASVANEKLNSMATIVYGTEREGGTFEAFSTEKTAIDSHVALLVDSTLMGAEVPNKKPIKIDNMTLQQKYQAVLEANRRLEKQNGDSTKIL